MKISSSISTPKKVCPCYRWQNVFLLIDLPSIAWSGIKSLSKLAFDLTDSIIRRYPPKVL